MRSLLFSQSDDSHLISKQKAGRHVEGAGSDAHRKQQGGVRGAGNGEEEGQRRETSIELERRPTAGGERWQALCSMLYGISRALCASPLPPLQINQRSVLWVQRSTR